MMKPDTPKFAEPACAHKRVAAFTEEKNGVVYREYWACEDCRKEFIAAAPDGLQQKRDRVIAFIHAAKQNPDSFYVGLDVLLDVEEVIKAAAPKPDCVGVEALIADYMQFENESDIPPEMYGYLARWTHKYIKDNGGLLAVKEKAQERGEHPEPFQDEELKG